MVLQVLVVEDSESDLKQYLKDFAKVFDDQNIEACLHGCSDFDEAIAIVSDPSRRFDLVISDTYRGKPAEGDTRVLDLVFRYRNKGKRFCPIVVYSSSVKPDTLDESDFVLWADKAKPDGIEEAIIQILSTGVPQIARKLHDELDRAAGSYLWEFLEKRWSELTDNGNMPAKILERVIRRRAAAQIGDMEIVGDKWMPITGRAASEYYIYPRLHAQYYGLGDVLKCKKDELDIRLILTPHCHLYLRAGKTEPNADHVLTVKTVSVSDVLGEKLENAGKLKDQEARHKKLRLWSRSPAETNQSPEGRHWYLPAFLEVPHLYCDFLQVESIPYADLKDYDAIATLVPPYAEAMQSCFAGFYASVGIPEIEPESIEDLLT